jgi:hypothetical protein
VYVVAQIATSLKKSGNNSKKKIGYINMQTGKEKRE